MPSKLQLIAGAVVAVLVAGWYAQKKLRDALPAGALNPLSDQNLAYSGVNAIGASLSGNRDFSLGAWLWEQTHPSQVALEQQLVTPTGHTTQNAPAILAQVDERSPFDFEMR